VSRLARYHLVAALVMLAVTITVFVIAVRQWLHEGRPPIVSMWPEQALVACGAYRFVYHIKAFNKARKPS
jgi:hypothetical protein